MPMADRKNSTVHRYIHGLFCEGRNGGNQGTSSYIGVYPHAVAISHPLPTVPMVFPRLVAVFWIVCPLDEDFPELQMSFHMPDASNIPIPTLDSITIDGDASGRSSKLGTGNIRASNLVVTQPGYLRLRIQAWGLDWTAASLKVVSDTS